MASPRRKRVGAQTKRTIIGTGGGETVASKFAPSPTPPPPLAQGPLSRSHLCALAQRQRVRSAIAPLLRAVRKSGEHPVGGLSVVGCREGVGCREACTRAPSSTNNNPPSRHSPLLRDLSERPKAGRRGGKSDLAQSLANAWSSFSSSDWAAARLSRSAWMTWAGARST